MKKILIIVALMVMTLPLLAAAADFSYGHYESLLKQRVKLGVTINNIRVNAVDYAVLRQDANRPDSDYSLLLKVLATFDPATLKSREEQIAFWVNAYNIGAIKTIVDHYPVDSIRSKKIQWLGQPWNRKVLNVGGKDYSLAEIENDILLDGYKDLRIHFGINCASVSCADLLDKPYRAASLFSQLEEQGRKLLADPQKGLFIDPGKKTVFLSQIFKFDKKNFDTLGGGALAFIKPYLTATERAKIEAGGLRLDYLDYDWQANDVKSTR